ncbi:MAG: hypothetical protein WDZ90_02010 [Candidatus Paceibacterota bacterium]
MTKIVHVIPIARGIKRERLSYFTGVSAEAGSIVSVPLRKKTVPALVIDTEEVSEAKSRIRSAGYTIKKTNARSAKQVLLPAFLRATKRAKEYYASTTGSTLFSILPQSLFKDLAKLETPEFKKQKQKEEQSESNIAIQKLVLQAERHDRVEHYKNIARESFAKKESVLIVAPSLQEAERLEKSLTRGIEKYTHIFHSGLTPATLRKKWKETLEESHPILIIMTGGFLSLPRQDIKTIILERENSPLFKLPMRPYLDVRLFTEYLAEEMGARLIFADFPLSAEIVMRYKERGLEEFAPFKIRAASRVATKVVDMRAKEEKFTVLGGELKVLLEEARHESQHVFLFASRRGISPITVCQDCGNPVVCDISGAPVVLHKGTKGNVFVCHASGTVRSAQERCRFCDSWKLQSLGIGAELVEEEVKKAFPSLPCFVLERDRAPSHKKAKEIAEKFYKERSAVLVGTEMAIPYLEEPVRTSAIVSIDSFLSLPEWNIYERVFSILLRIRETTEHTMLIQTRKKDLPILSLAATGNANEFYKTELEERKRFSYPPYATLIKCTFEGTEAGIEKLLDEAKHTLAPYEFSGVSHHMHLGYGKYKVHAFLRLDPDLWPKKELAEKLRLLPPSVAVSVDPQSIL